MRSSPCATGFDAVASILVADSRFPIPDSRFPIPHFAAKSSI
ncbi:hypothetical protein [Moorena sp. SIO1F2]|nr:hypothetical protein [Moorena sp. SIO1F2]